MNNEQRKRKVDGRERTGMVEIIVLIALLVLIILIVTCCVKY